MTSGRDPDDLEKYVMIQKDRALKQLETALCLYFKGEDYYSVITLAGASEEIFGKLLPDGTDAFGIFNKIFVKAQQLLRGQPLDADAEKADAKKWADRSNYARNRLKHLDSNPQALDWDPEQEAGDMLTRAIDNYWHLNEDLTPPMRRFQDKGTSD